MWSTNWSEKWKAGFVFLCRTLARILSLEPPLSPEPPPKNSQQKTSETKAPEISIADIVPTSSPKAYGAHRHPSEPGLPSFI